MTACAHCKREDVQVRARGLCSRCYSRRSIRDLYPAQFGFVLRKPERQETEADLDRIIAEQRQCLPKWWDKAGRNTRWT